MVSATWLLPATQYIKYIGIAVTVRVNTTSSSRTLYCIQKAQMLASSGEISIVAQFGDVFIIIHRSPSYRLFIELLNEVQ